MEYLTNEVMEVDVSVSKSLHNGELCIETLRSSTACSDMPCVEYINAPINYGDFFHNFLLPNRPCMLGKWATQGWKSIREWVSHNSVPDLDWLKMHFGDASCPVANCDEEKFSSHTKTTMLFSEFVDYLISLNSGNEVDEPCLYLKDWHFTRCFPQYEAYKTPVYFQSDWLNEFCDKRRDESDDYRFVYFGPKGSWTPFHVDVLRSYSWSANICGRKRWLLYPPGAEDSFKSNLGTLVFDLNSLELEDRKRYPKAGNRPKEIEVIQESGEVIFVPSGWHHQVFNLEDTISINHNWLNGCCIDLCWQHLCSSLSDVHKEISDCRDMDGWHEQCQVILKAVTGSNFYEFFSLLQIIGKQRLQALIENNSRDGMNTSNADQGHVLFDLVQISTVLDLMMNVPEFSELTLENVSIETIRHFHKNIKDALSLHLN